jgi:hypothetical protein
MARERFLQMTNDTPIRMEEVTDPVQLAQARRRGEFFDRNWSWFEAHASDIYRQHRGKCPCIAGEELFVMDTPEEAHRLARAAHPEDER